MCLCDDIYTSYLHIFYNLYRYSNAYRNAVYPIVVHLYIHHKLKRRGIFHILM
jgi:hypothetical protein